MTKLFNAQLAASIAHGTASLDELRRADASEILAAKTANVAHFRTVVRESKKRDGRTRSYVFSDDSLDRMKDIIKVGGWELDNFKRNPVILWGHNSAAPPIGKASKVKVTRVNGRRSLVGDVTFFEKDVNPMSETIFRLVEEGALKTTSVGFRPIEARFGDEITEKEREKLGLGRWSVIYEKQELLEDSIVSIPANPNAVELGLKSMISKGFLTDSEANDFLKIHPQNRAAADARVAASVRSFVDMGRLLTDTAKAIEVELEGVEDKAVESIADESVEVEVEVVIDDAPVEIDKRLDVEAKLLKISEDWDIYNGNLEDELRELTAMAEKLMPVEEPVELLESETDPVVAHTDALTKLTLALSGLIGQMSENTASVRQFTDVVHDFVQRADPQAAAPVLPEEVDGAEGGEEGDLTAKDAAELSKAAATAESIVAGLRGRF